MIFLDANLQRFRDELVIQRTKSTEFFRSFELSVFRDPLDDFACCGMKSNHEKPKVRKHEKETPRGLATILWFHQTGTEAAPGFVRSPLCGSIETYSVTSLGKGPGFVQRAPPLSVSYLPRGSGIRNPSRVVCPQFVNPASDHASLVPVLVHDPDCGGFTCGGAAEHDLCSIGRWTCPEIPDLISE